MHLNSPDGSPNIAGSPNEFLRIGFFHAFKPPNGPRRRAEAGKGRLRGADGRPHGAARQLIGGEGGDGSRVL